MRLLVPVLTTLGLALPLLADNSAPMDSASARSALPGLSPIPVTDQVDREVVRELARRAEVELRVNILPFWMGHARDFERGGFVGQIDNKLKVHTHAPRGSLLTSRVLWAFSAAYRHYGKPEYREMARWAFDDLVGRFWDNEHGGVIWALKSNGKPLEERKQIYAEAFALYGCTEYHRATGDEAALQRAIALYRLIETHAYDAEQGGYFEARAADWGALPAGSGNLIGADEPKSQNTMLHVMEAYSALYRVWPDAGLRSRLAELVDRMVTRVLDPRTSHLGLFFAADWARRSQTVSYGHDIEFSWLLMEAADVLGDEALIERLRPIALAVAKNTLAEGVDADGGVFNEGDPSGVTDKGKDWWPQAEAAVGFLNAYQLSGDATFLRTARRSWDFIEQHIVDREDGEWFWGRDARGRVVSHQPKLGMWKCPYHNSRACLELIERARLLLGEDAD